MIKHIRRMVITLLILIVAFISTSATLLAESEVLLKNKTNKLKLSDDLDEYSKYIKESLAAGKSLTYKIEVSKGALYIDLQNDTDFKVEIFDSKNKLVKKIKGYEMLGGVFYVARDGVGLSKGNYKIKISSMNKENALNIDGKIVMIKNTSRTVDFNKSYKIAVKEGKSYKFKFKLDEKSTLVLTYFINSYIPDNLWPYDPDTKILDSKGKAVEYFDNDDTVVLDKGTYTFVVKANVTGNLNLKVAK